MDDLDTAFTLFRFIGPVLGGISAIFVGMMLWAPLVLYILARWRQSRETNPDPQLGVKFALHYFATIAAQLGILAIALFIYSIVSNLGSEPNGEIRRVAGGMLLPAMLVLAGYVFLRTRTNDDQFPAVRRLYSGFQLMVTGAFAFILLVTGSQMLFAKGDTGGAGRAVLTFFLVYSGATAWYALRVAKLSGIAPGSGSSFGGGSGEVPRNIVTPVPSAGGLPPLGGGAYPPLDPQ